MPEQEIYVIEIIEPLGIFVTAAEADTYNQCSSLIWVIQIGDQILHSKWEDLKNYSDIIPILTLVCPY